VNSIHANKITEIFATKISVEAKLDPLNGVAKDSELSGHPKTRLVSLQSWNETAIGLLPALSLLD
jgi:hypothetical protein